jgi:peptidoglycan hydrolase CwlO-like protein
MNKTSTSGRFGIPVRVPSDKDFNEALSNQLQLSTVESLRPLDDSTARRHHRQAHEKRLNQVKKSFTKQVEDLHDTLSRALKDINNLNAENNTLKDTMKEYVN